MLRCVLKRLLQHACPAQWMICAAHGSRCLCGFFRVLSCTFTECSDTTSTCCIACHMPSVWPTPLCFQNGCSACCCLLDALLQAFRLRSQQQAAAGSFVNSGVLPRVSSAAQQLAVRLSPTKDADAQTVCWQYIVTTSLSYITPVPQPHSYTTTHPTVGCKHA